MTRPSVDLSTVSGDVFILSYRYLSIYLSILLHLYLSCYLYLSIYLSILLHLYLSFYLFVSKHI